MARGAGYRNALRHHHAGGLQARLPELLTDEGPIFVELHTGAGRQTPMTARGGKSFPEQVETLRSKLLAAR